MESVLQKILDRNSQYIEKGKVADYIPALGSMDKKLLGLSFMDSRGELYKVGDTSSKFTIQSISKVIGLMVAIQERGEGYVFDKIGYYGTDKPFNYYANLDHNKPLNPYMNAGAILVTSLIDGEDFLPYEKIRDMIRYITKNESIDYNEEVYRSEKSTGDRNRGIFYILKNSDLIDKGDISLDNYFKQCSLEIDTDDLAKIGYFFSNNCIRFDQDRRYESRDLAKIINSTMMMAGMYDYSGEYGRQIGIPSKSGVGGE